MTIFEVLRRDYADITGLFRQIQEHLQQNREQRAREVFQGLAQKLLAGMQAERAIVLPRFAFCGLSTEVADAQRQHALIEETVNQLRLVPLVTFHWQGVVELLERLVTRYVDLLEEEVFPFAQLTLDVGDPERIATDYLAYEVFTSRVAGASITYELAS